MVAAAAVAIALTGVGATPAHAQFSGTPLYTGGSTLAQFFYRDLFSCYGSNGTAPLADNGGTGGAGFATGTPAFQTFCAGGGFPINSNTEALYAGVGSGNGLFAIENYAGGAPNLTHNGHNPQQDPIPYSGDLNSSGNAFYGTNAVGAAYAPATTPTFPGLQATASDDPMHATDLVSYEAGPGHTDGTDGSGLSYGPPVQFPTLVTGVAIAFNKLDGNGNPMVTKGKKPGAVLPGYSTYMDLDLNTWCGIFTGAYNTWDVVPHTGGGQTVNYGAGQVHIAWRNDGSGTTFLFTQALMNQCGTQTNPLHGVTNNVPDQWLTDNGITNTAGTTSFTSNDNFYINVNSHGHLPTIALGGPFDNTGGNGSNGVEAIVAGNNGGIGYLTPGQVAGVGSSTTDLTQPPPLAAAVQVLSTVGGAAVYDQPTTAAVSKIMSTVAVPSALANSCTKDNGGVPPFTWAAGTSPDGICQHNPVNWGGVNPAPTTASTYPIGGFTFFFTFSCYANANEAAVLFSDAKLPYLYNGVTSTTEGLWYWHLKNSSATKVAGQVLAADGFAVLPSTWAGAIEKLLTSDKKAAPQWIGEKISGKNPSAFYDSSTCLTGA
jgi:ABC-type phosphate transport system substrate-binding protein